MIYDIKNYTIIQPYFGRIQDFLTITAQILTALRPISFPSLPCLLQTRRYLPRPNTCHRHVFYLASLGRSLRFPYGKKEQTPKGCLFFFGELRRSEYKYYALIRRQFHGG